MKEEAKAQVAYRVYMAQLSKNLPKKTYKTIGENSVPGLDTLIANIVQLCDDNPDFISGLSVAISKGASLAKEKFGGISNSKRRRLFFIASCLLTTGRPWR